jgi:hypothetical protein
VSNYAIREVAGTPTNGTTAIFTLTRSGASTGTFRLGVGTAVTAPIAAAAVASTIQTALRALSVVGSGNCNVSGDTSPTVITMAGDRVKEDFGPIYVATNSTNGTVSIAESTPGITATQRSAPFGTLLVDNTTGDRYTNRSTTASAPDWRRHRAVSHHTLYIPLADITAATLYTYTPGFAGKIIKHDAAVETVSSASTKLATLTWKIAGTATTGGAVGVTTANTASKGAAIAGSAVTAANSFGATDALTLVGSSVTPFIEGAIWDVLQIEIDEAP